ncbi:MAG: aromatic acid exporter family protein [Actinobacteria bacterium]|nr:aromatic acid exporter family protein [Actinomycetota bacterium]
MTCLTNRLAARLAAAAASDENGRVLEWWRRVPRSELSRLRREGRSSLLWSLRVTVAATASFVVALLIFPGTQPLLAPLTAMLVVQVTPVSLLASGLDRVVAVVAGVSLAVAFSSVVPLHWWSLGVLIFVSITVGQALRLRSNLVEVAIGGMLVLGVGALGAEAAASQRILETLVGAAVGIAANLLLPPKVASADAGRAIDGLADAMSELLRRSADELCELVARGGDITPAARGWLDEARTINHDIPRIGATLMRAEESRRLNVRAVGRADVGPGLRQGLEALEHSSVSIRSTYRALLDALYDGSWLGDEAAADVLLGLAETFRDMAGGVDAFGALVRDEADPGVRLSTTDVDAVPIALDGLREARARLRDVLLTDSPAALVLLHASVLESVQRLLQEMDLDERIRRQVRLRRPSRVRRTPGSDATEPPDPTADAETQLLPAQRRSRRPRPRR